MKLDARVVRTRAALQRAVIELAAEKPLAQISVSELADAAGVNRVTFYKHFSEPSEVLESALREDLEPARQHFVELYLDPSTTPASVLSISLDEILDHIERFRAVYDVAVNTSTQRCLPRFMYTHFTELFEQFLRARETMSPPMPEHDASIVATFFAHGLVGAIAAWLARGSSDREPLIQAVLILYPEWAHAA